MVGQGKEQRNDEREASGNRAYQKESDKRGLLYSCKKGLKSYLNLSTISPFHSKTKEQFIRFYNICMEASK